MTLLRPQLVADYTDRFWFPQSASTFSDEVDWTYMLVLWICLFFLIPITFALVYFTIRYTKRKGTPAESQVSHNTPLEVAWSVLPSFLLVWIFVQGALGFIDQQTPPEGAASVGVRANTWSWSMDYGNGVSHPELHIVNDRPTKLTMRSVDVIHSLFIPAFRTKRDVVPGRYNEMWFHPKVASERVSQSELDAALQDTKDNHAGVFDPERYQFTRDGYRYFDLYCTEYCGKDHSLMKSFVIVHKTQDDLDAWIKANSMRPEGTPPAEYGALLYQRACVSCHSIDGTRRVGPTFLGAYGSRRDFVSGQSGIVDENYIRQSILEPKAQVVAGYNPVMPSFKGQFSDDDIDSIIAYLKTLAEPGGADAPAAQ